jgi:CLIP-associating protein 1/2
MCYRVFARCWPDRARRLFQTLDPNIQRLINEEDRGFHKSFSSLAVHDRGSYQQQPLRQSTGTLVATQPMTGGGSTLPFYENSTKTTNNSSMNLVAGVGAANLSSLSVSKSIDVAPDRTLESVLQASQQQVNAIETMLRGFDTSDKGAVSTAVRMAERDPGTNIPAVVPSYSWNVALENTKDAMGKV